jgi:hypothetical protein
MNPYLKYTNLAFQLILYIFSGYYFGKWIAEHLGYGNSAGSAIGILVMLMIGLTKIIRDLLQENK